MSDDEKSNESVDSTNETVAENKGIGHIVATLMALKQSNPKVLYGSIGALVIIIFIMSLLGGDSNNPLPVVKMTNVSIGQNYTLRAANTVIPSATVRLVAIPGSMAAYDDTEEADRIGDCKHIPQGTKVKATQIQQAFTKVQFVEVEMLAGECAGRKGWVSTTNLN